MSCEKCGKEIDEQVSYCPYCGAKIERAEKYCNACGKKNMKEASYCIACGAPFDRTVPKDESMEESSIFTKYKKIINIFFFCLAIILLILNFSACFSNFLLIKWPDHYLEVTDSPYHNIAVSFANAVDIIQSNHLESAKQLNASFTVLIIIVPMIGTLVTLIVGICLGFYQGLSKRSIPNIKKQVAISLAFLFCGMLMMGLFRTKTQGTTKAFIGYGSFVMTCVWLSIVYLFSTTIHRLLVVIFGEKSKSEITKIILNMVASSILIVLLFSISASVLSVSLENKTVHSSGYLMIQLLDQSQLRLSEDVADLYLVSEELFLLNISMIIVTIVFLTKRFSQLDKKRYKASFASGVTTMILGFVSLLFSLACKNRYEKIYSMMGKISLGSSMH